LLSCHDFHNNETATVWQTNSFRNRKREQEKQIRPLVCEAAGEIESIFSLTCERMTEVFQKLNERQAQFLTPAQKGCSWKKWSWNAGSSSTAIQNRTPSSTCRSRCPLEPLRNARLPVSAGP